ncbi:MAG: mannose-6-phosphate isomerase, class I [Actinomycetales bacterium]|nr:mannose-6-phosphate isomerase, class I [Actinomycetales bacterium]
MLIVRGAIKDYDWGIVDGLERWSNRTTGGPQAELWFGVHPGGPSPVVDSDGVPTGELLADRFDVEAIPLLVKLLAAARPLSVQLHPTRQRARDGWEAQRQEGSPPVFSDPFEKTEMLVALDPFEAFVGWRDIREAAAVLRGIDGTEEAVAALEAGRLGEAIRLLLDLASDERVAALPAAASAAGLPPEQVEAYAIVAENYPGDQGGLLTPLLAYLKLEPGQAVYVPAGLPHSYIRGTGLEVMTSSDNVIRLGLTSKAVFVDHAIEALIPGLQPQFMPTTHGDLIWPIDSPFVVRVHRTGTERIQQGSYRIVLLIEGEATVASEFGEIVLSPGTAAVIASDDPDNYVTSNGLVAIIQSTER